MKNSFKLMLCCLVLIASCNNPMKVNEAHGKGTAKIYIEESFKPLFDTSIYTFEGQNPLADIIPVYKTEEEILQDFFAKKVETMCITRDLTESELAKLKKANIEVRSEILAKDAVALIINPENPDSTISIDQLKDILTGKTKTWSSLKTGINVVFDHENSANFNYLKNLSGVTKVPENIFAVKSNAEVINYVKNNKSAIGVIGVNWISDEDDPQTLDFLNGIRVMSVSKTAKSESFKPYQSYIYDKQYPMTRDLWVVNYASRSGVSSGFLLFMTGEKGQLLIQKSSLIPANMVARVIQLKSE
jgi:phosphate transport system substrate-binding protein